MILSLLAGIALTFVWPMFINFFINIFTFISKDLNNPINLFIYGIVNRLLSIINFSHWMNQLFWFTNLGGSWVDPVGAVHTGDVGMWTAQLARGISGFSSGKLISPYYILNIFAVPAFIMAAFQTYTDKLVHKRLVPFVILAVVMSILFGTLLPIEIFLIFTAPLLFTFHLFFTAILYAVLPMLGVTLGYSFSGNVLVGTPGSIVDLLVLIRNPIYQKALIILLFVG
jgi:phosphotransferase system  glucose/maltose/N-acetylglucosamine-specific IIC component